jgi:hypothetical protein
MEKQENESLDVFLWRSKPSNLETAARSLISIANPHVGDWPSSDVDPFNLEGQTLLDKCEAREEQLGDAEDSDSGSVSRRRRSLERSIPGLAKQTYIVEGKWMVHPPSNLVDTTWERVARATFEGRLGYGAKVSRVNREGKEGFATWVQTEDFGSGGCEEGSKGTAKSPAIPAPSVSLEYLLQNRCLHSLGFVPRERIWA